MNKEPEINERTPWWKVDNEGEIPSPALLVYPERVQENIERMIRIAGDLSRLRPHIKTHKLPEIVWMQMTAGITKFKCATIAEAEMALDCGVTDLLLAYQPVGPNIERLRTLIRRFPQADVSVVVDDPGVVGSLSGAFGSEDSPLEVLIDIDCGMNRTGIAPGPEAVALYRSISEMPGLTPGGLHAYDGHIGQSDLAERTRVCDAAFAGVTRLRDDLISAGLPVPRLVAGGTPTFPIHARRDGVESSPGTCLFWDAGYAAKLPDMDFLVAALVFTRVVSKPGGNRLCLDLGHKAVAAENPHPRVEWPGLSDARSTLQSEEHLVLETEEADRFKVGDGFYGIPRHICPTVALHSRAWVIENGTVAGFWKVTARERIITV
jgi:D-threonine aldolase